ncbi:unnamed protein product [Cercospora beticola]|nr:unnamed protein product [Cercospora beticola]
MRLSANWALQVVTRAEYHYRNLSSTLFSLFKRLGPEMESYENWWGLFTSRNAVTVSRLREIVVAESGQLEKLFAKAMPVQDAVQRVVEEFTQDEDEAQKKILWKLEEAAREGKLE